MKTIFATLILCIVACNAAFTSDKVITPANFFSHFQKLATMMTCDNQQNVWDDTSRVYPDLQSASSPRVLRAYYEPSTQQVLAPRVKSIDGFVKPGTLLIVDINHIPDGPTSWPALWTVQGTPCSANNWPNSGEFDIIESALLNNDMQNKPNMHSGPNCNIPYTAFSYDPSGNYPPWTWRPNGYSQTTVSCTSGSGTNNYGCVWNGRPQWTDFRTVNNNGGAVYALWWKKGDASASFYFWRRTDTMPDFNNPNPSSWTPFASWPSTACSQMSSWTNHNLIIDLKICGNLYGSSCTASHVSSDYNNQYWGINGIKSFIES